MATRAKALRQFAKKYFNLDLVGLSETAVLKDLLKKEYNIDAVGNSVVSVLMNAAGDDGGGDAADLVTLAPQTEPSVFMSVDDDVCELFAHPAQLLTSVTLGDETLAVENGTQSDFYTACVNGDFDWRMTINGTTTPWMSENERVGETMNLNTHFSYPCGQYNEGDIVSVTVDVKYKGETGKITIPNVPISMD